MSDETRRRLEQAGSRPVPEPDPAFADAAGGSAAGGRRDVAGPARAHRTRPLAGAATTVDRAGPRGAERPRRRPGRHASGPRTANPALRRCLRVRSTSTVALTDGTVLDATDGLSLPDGAVVTVGEGGYARIGDQVLRAGDVVTIARAVDPGSTTTARSAS